MLAIAVVLLFGAGLGALGLVAPDMYVVGAIIVFIGGIGLVVRLGERLSRLRAP
jgi:hypothetical protein